MGVNKADLASVKTILMPNEKVYITSTQRRVGPGGSILNPTTLVCTDNRILVVNRASFGLRKDYESIPYRQITSVRLEYGFINASVLIRIQGYDKDAGLLKSGKFEGEITGLNKDDAKLMTDFITKMIELHQTSGKQSSVPNMEIKPVYSKRANIVYCNKCGAPNDVGSKFCSSCGSKLV